ncbi:PQQ-binding-like beta-propeller repeat protein [Halocatena marina]|uniref:outer membrane protein assembly factor BamB family protein n=1 Tax=Halocatena marina TaxID=2934937 RepID=UPI0036164DEE
MVRPLFGCCLRCFTTHWRRGELTEQWVSDTARGYQQNHHPIAATNTGNGTIVVAPINDESNESTQASCALVRLNESSGNTVWQSGLAPENCTIHSLPDSTIADLDGDGTQEILIARGDHTLTVHDAATGAIEWRHPTSSLGYSQPVVRDILPADGKEVVAVDIDGELFVIRSDGSTAWHRNLSASTWAVPQSTISTTMDKERSRSVLLTAFLSSSVTENERGRRTIRSSGWFLRPLVPTRHPNLSLPMIQIKR